MAYKYSKQFQNYDGLTYRVDIFDDDWTAPDGVTTPDKMGADPLQLRSLASQRDEYNVVTGTELLFEFVLAKRANESAYDPLFESTYREFVVEFYNDDTSTLIWEGYLMPENLNKSVFESNLHLYFSATDALKDLKDFEFTDSGLFITGRKTPLEILKLALDNLGFEDNITVKLGTKPDGMTTDNHNALKYCTHDTRRFYRVKSGKTEIDDCLTVIEKTLRPYDCALMKHADIYYVIHRYEQATYYYNYLWSDLSLVGNRAASGDNVNIDTYNFRRSADMSYLPSVKEMGMTLYNRNIGGSIVTDLQEYDDPAVWDTDNYTSEFTYNSGFEMQAEHNAVLPYDNGYITLEVGANVAKITDNDYIKLKFDYKTNGTIVTEEFPEFRITVIKDGSEYPQEWIRFQNSFIKYESPLSGDWKMIGTIGVAENYNFKIEIRSNDDTSDYTCYLTNFECTREIIEDGESVTDIAFDRFYKAESDQGKIRQEEAVDMYFGDSANLNDFASIVYDGVVTEEWDRQGETDGLKLLQLYALNYLTGRKRYSEYLIIDVKDLSDNIAHINYIQFDSKAYKIASYEKSYRSSWVKLHLREIITGDITLSWSEVSLTTVDGEDTGMATSTTVGVEGTQGPQGDTGAQGPQGEQGDQGAQGEQGNQGTQGEEGEMGPQGTQGNQGVPGEGEPGEQGPQGYQGTQGTQGVQGEEGDQGVQGEEGEMGPQGTQGNQGVVGPPGEQGDQGTQGVQGAQGTQGNQGYQGTQGVQGHQGDEGEMGVQGPQGVQGAIGEGEMGPQGYQGNQGNQGAQGNQGYQGATGAQGPQGVQGEQGNQGYQGYQGNQGEEGEINVTSGTADPSGGSDGDIYFQYE